MHLILIVGMIVTAVSSGVVAQDNPIDRLKEQAGQDPDKLVRLGDLYIEAMRLDEAKRSYKQAKWRVKDNPEARFGMVKIYMAQNKFQNAKHFCRKLTHDFPKLSTGDVCSGQFWLGNARTSRAVEAFERAVSKGDVARGKTGIAEAERRMAKWDAALAAYNEALQANAGYVAYLGKGLVLAQKGNKAGAIDAIKKAVEKEPASCLARYHLGVLLGKTSEAIESLKTALMIRPDWYDGYFALAEAYVANGNSADAAAAFEKAIKADRSRGEAHLGLAKVLFGQRKFDKALESLQKVVDKIPNHAEAYLLFAEIYYQKKEHDQAIEALDRARGVASGDVDILVRSAEIYMELGRYTNARAFLSQVISTHPKSSKAYAMLGEIACSRKQFDEGKAYFQKALSGDLKGVSQSKLKKKQSACHK